MLVLQIAGGIVLGMLLLSALPGLLIGVMRLITRAADPLPRRVAGPTYLAVGMLLVAIFVEMPYAYYAWLRVVCCAVATYLFFRARATRHSVWSVVMGVLSVTYNPFLHVTMERETWAVVNLATIAALIIFERSAARDAAWGTGLTPP